MFDFDDLDEAEVSFGVSLRCWTLVKPLCLHGQAEPVKEPASPKQTAAEPERHEPEDAAGPQTPQAPQVPEAAPEPASTRSVELRPLASRDEEGDAKVAAEVPSPIPCSGFLPRFALTNAS